MATNGKHSQDNDNDKYKDNDNDKNKYNDDDNERVRDALSLFSPRGGYIYFFSRGREKMMPPDRNI